MSHSTIVNRALKFRHRNISSTITLIFQFKIALKEDSCLKLEK